MILTAQQPQYFPNYYYLYKIFQGNVFLFADHLKYRKQTLTNRAFISDNKEQKPLILPVIKNTPGSSAIKGV
ncbi:MAG: WbqC family protein, partial [Calditrichia bacterium]